MHKESTGKETKRITVAEYLFDHAERMPGKAALISDRGIMTWSELEYRSGQLARYLTLKGIRRGTRIAYRLAGNEFFYILFLACSIVGCTAVGIGMQYTESEEKAVLRASGARLYFNMHIPEVVWQMKPYYGNGEVDTNDSLFTLYTSGTTGKPKGISITQKNAITSALLEAEHFCNGCTEEDIFQLQVPVNHISGAVEWGVTSIVAGCTCVLNDRFDAEKVLENTEKYRITMLCGVPSMWNMMLPRAAKYDLSSVRWCMSGASPVTAKLIKRIADICPEISNPLGLTETSGFCTYSDIHATSENLTDTVGRPVIPCKIIADPGEIGPIAWSGDTISPSAPRDEEGWFISGDLGFMDADGQLHLRGRSDDVYFTGGYTVYPAEIELVLLEHPDVASCCVVPHPSKLMGSISRAVIVPKQGREPDVGKIRAYLEDRLVYYKVPRKYEFRESLPVNSMGKVIRSMLIRD